MTAISLTWASVTSGLADACTRSWRAGGLSLVYTPIEAVTLDLFS